MGLLDDALSAIGLGSKPLPKLYTRVSLFLEGTKLCETTRISAKMDSRASDIETLDMGFAGISPGAKRIIITVTNAVPATDFELVPFLSPTAFMIGADGPVDKPVELSVVAAKKHLTTLGWFRTWALDYSVGGKADLNFEFVGFAKPWQ